MALGNRHSQHSFAQVPQANMARSKFDRSFACKDTMLFDDLTPFFLEEILPGDTINLNVKSLIRLATQEFPLMDAMYMDFHFFFVPNRLIWENWEKFNGAQDDPGDSTSFIIPTTTSTAVTGYPVGSLYDHFGLPTDVPGLVHSALPARAYLRIFNEWYRDQNLVPSETVSYGDGPDAPFTNINLGLLQRAKRPDYFTTAFTTPQKGPAVTMPLGATAPVVSTAAPVVIRGLTGSMTNLLTSGSGSSSITINTATTAGTINFGASGTTTTGLMADLATAVGPSINLFRQAIMLQSLLELDMRGGTRYVEILKAHFNVISPDFRLQRTEYLSGGTITLNQHVIPQTSESNTTPQGNLAAFTTGNINGNEIGFTKSFVEHGYVIGICSARGEVTYQQGIDRMWTRSGRFDFFWPKLQELGEQTILGKELVAQGSANPTADAAVWGYQERYAEYRYRPSQIKGQFRSTYAQSLDAWHLAEELVPGVALNSGFIPMNTPIERNIILPDPNYPHLLCDFFFDLKHARPIMTYGVPATLGRF